MGFSLSGWVLLPAKEAQTTIKSDWSMTNNQQSSINDKRQLLELWNTSNNVNSSLNFTMSFISITHLTRRAVTSQKNTIHSFNLGKVQHFRRALHTTKNKSEKTSSSSSLSSSSSSSSSGFSPIVWYARKLESHPLTTKCLTSGFISGAADFICQYIYHRNEHGTFSPDWMRTGRFSLLGFGLIAPVVHNWYGFLTRKIPGQSIPAVLKRLFLDQILFAPLFIPTFMTSLMFLEGKRMDVIPAVLIKDVPDVVVTNWILWIPAMFVNFRFVPVQWQVLYSNCVGLVWNVYLSWKTQEK